MTKISVITATWNCVETIQDCLAAVEAQSHPNIEHVVIDGGSRDGTMDILDTKRGQLAVLLSEPDQGI
jgi:glycosyltransferase